MKSYQPKHMLNDNNKKDYNDEKVTIPEIYPDYRTIKANIPIASYSNVKQAKDWVEFNKL